VLRSGDALRRRSDRLWLICRRHHSPWRGVWLPRGAGVWLPVSAWIWLPVGAWVWLPVSAGRAGSATVVVTVRRRGIGARVGIVAVAKRRMGRVVPKATPPPPPTPPPAPPAPPAPAPAGPSPTPAAPAPADPEPRPAEAKGKDEGRSVMEMSVMEMSIV